MQFAQIAKRFGKLLTGADPGPATVGARPDFNPDFALEDPVFRGGGSACVALIGTEGRLISLSGPARALFQRASEAVCLASLFVPEDRPEIERAIGDKTIDRIEARARRGSAVSDQRRGSADCNQRRGSAVCGQGPDREGGQFKKQRPFSRDGDIGVFELCFQRRPDGRANVLIIDRTKAHAELGAMARKADRASADARASAARLADLSHEMRTPLNAVIGFADTMRGETFGPLGHDKYAEYVDHIHQSGAHLLDLVNAILDLAKIGADRYTLTRVKTDPAAIGKACAEMVRMSAEKAGLKLITDFADDVPESFLDPRALRQILLNLLSNAVKFTSDGEIHLKAAADNGDIVFTVKDSGVGMSAQELEKLGARFTATQEAGVRGAGGAGLGLALAFALAELHGGTLSLASAPGEGVTAIVRLPVIAPARPDRLTHDPNGRPHNASTALSSVDGEKTENVLTQLERIEAYRREVASSRASSAA